MTKVLRNVALIWVAVLVLGLGLPAHAAPPPPGHCMGRYVRHLPYWMCISLGHSWIKPNGHIICFFACGNALKEIT